MTPTCDFMLLIPLEQTETAPPLGNEDFLGPNPDHPFMPPTLYLPATGVLSAQSMGIELRRLRGGRMALLAYTAIDRLVKCMGPHQPQALFLAESLNDLAERQPLDIIMPSQRIPQEFWHQKDRRQ